MFCKCPDWEEINNVQELVYKHPTYGWVLKWVKLTNMDGYTQLDNYGIKIKYCPFCGKPISNGDIKYYD